MQLSNTSAPFASFGPETSTNGNTAKCEEATMQAIGIDKYGNSSVLKSIRVPKPEPKKGEVLVRIRATAINAGDHHLMTGKPGIIRLMFGLFRPKTKILGADLAGHVEALGEGVDTFQRGDEVFGDISNVGFGAFAEYVCVPADVLALKPKGLTFEEAASLPEAGVTALQALRDYAAIKPGDKVLINGASGGVGSYAIQIAKAMGAEVTAVCSSHHVEAAWQLKANHVIDYTREDFTQGKKVYDAILAIGGYHKLSAYKRVLSFNGKYVMIGGKVRQMFEALLLGPLYSEKGGISMKNMLANPNRADLLFLKNLLEEGKLKPVIGARYSLNEIPMAMAQYEKGHNLGKIVISV